MRAATASVHRLVAGIHGDAAGHAARRRSWDRRLAVTRADPGVSDLS
jgi:hypothetical protein